MMVIKLCSLFNHKERGIKRIYYLWQLTNIIIMSTSVISPTVCTDSLNYTNTRNVKLSYLYQLYSIFKTIALTLKRYDVYMEPKGFLHFTMLILCRNMIIDNPLT